MSDADRPKNPEAARPPDTAVWAAVSHEIRTPLTGVMGMLEVLGHTSLTEEQRRIIATAESSSRALMRIVNDVLDFARLESTSVTLDPAPTDIGALTEDCAAFIAGAASAKGLNVSCETDHRLPLVICDPVRVRQLLVNLGGNAVKFTDRGDVAFSVRMTGAAGMSATEPGVKLRLSVADSGIGIPEELRSLLFQPFSRLRAGGDARGGVGLGLAICRRLVEIMGGAIAVDAAAGTGSVFHVDLTLPVAVAAPAATVPAGVNVMAVDGDPATAIALGYLEAAGASVVRAGSLADIAQGLGAARPGAVLVVLGPEAEAEDIAATGNALRAMAYVAPSLLWLKPRMTGHRAAAGPGVDSINAYPLRRAELLEAACRALAPVGPEAPVVTRRAAPNGAFAAVRDDQAATARAEGRLVLVAEDNPINQDVLCQQLSILGFDCDIAENGAAALKALENGQYLAMLCDCHMPGMDGFELTRRVRESEGAGAHRLPIIAVTANALPGEAARCRAAGMDDYLPKPIEIRSLSAMLERWIPAAVRELPAPTTAGESAAVVDTRNLEAIYGSDPGKLARVLKEWRTGIEDSVAAINRAFSSGRLELAVEAAHRIKGSAGIAGAFGLSADAAVLEAALREGRMEDARAAARRVELTAGRALGLVARETRDTAAAG